MKASRLLPAIFCSARLYTVHCTVRRVHVHVLSYGPDGQDPVRICSHLSLKLLISTGEKTAGVYWSNFLGGDLPTCESIINTLIE